MTCREEYRGYICTEPSGHSGKHTAADVAGRVVQRWYNYNPVPTDDLVERGLIDDGPVCGELHGVMTCTLQKGHTGDHEAWGVAKLHDVWPRTEPEPSGEAPVPLSGTARELLADLVADGMLVERCGICFCSRSEHVPGGDGDGCDYLEAWTARWLDPEDKEA